MTTFTCIVIDDDHFATEQLREYINKTPFLKLIKCYNDPIIALGEMKNMTNPIDFLITDVEMPKLDGITLSKNLSYAFRYLVLISGHLEYAAVGYGIHAKQFITKPFDLKKFTSIIRSLIESIIVERPFIMIKLGSNKEILKVFTDEIIIIQGASNYIKIETTYKTFVPYLKISTMEENLRTNLNFMRINKSNIISARHIKSVTGYVIMLDNGISVKVTKPYHAKFNWFMKHIVCLNASNDGSIMN